MKVLVVHNQYRTSAPSGEDYAVENEFGMLQRRGVDAHILTRCNDDLNTNTALSQVATSAQSIWSFDARREVAARVSELRPDIVHVHNTFAALSPSIYGACTAHGAAVVQTLHNYRLLCPSALFLRDGVPCELCLTGGLHNAIRYKCYRNSVAATGAIVATLLLHKALDTYNSHVSQFIALTQFAKHRFVQSGIDAERISIKPNFLPHPPEAGAGMGGYVAYVGRLLEGKGTQTLLAAWKHLPDITLKVVGDGALRQDLENVARRDNLNVEFLGTQTRSHVLDIISNAALLVVPSECYEGFPLVVAESYACGTPIVASRIGGLAELITDNVTGATFQPCNASDLANVLRALFTNGPALVQMRKACRAYHSTTLTEESNYEQLCSIYAMALETRRPRT